MYYKYLLIFLIQFTFSITLAQSKFEVISKDKLEQLTDKINKQQYQIDSLMKFRLIHEEVLKQATQTISHQNSIISSFGNIYTVLTTLIGLLTFVIPFVTWQFGLKPSRQALKELSENIDQKFHSYLSDSREKQISKAITELKNGDRDTKKSAIDFLLGIQYGGFSDAALFNIFQLVKKGRKTEYYIELVNILKSKNNEYINDVFNDPHLIKDVYTRHNAYRHYGKIGVEKIGENLKKYLNINQEFKAFVTATTYESLNNALRLFDMNDFVDGLEESVLQDWKSYYTNYLQSYNIKKEEFTKTYFYKKIKTLDSDIEEASDE